MPFLEKYLPQPLRGVSSSSVKKSDAADATVEEEEEVYKQGCEIAAILFQGRRLGGVDILGHLGFQLNRWSAVRALLDKLIDSFQELQRVSLPRFPTLSNLDWGSISGVSLDRISSGGASEDGKQWSTYVKLLASRSASPTSGSLDILSEPPYVNKMAHRLMAEVWFSLGSLVLDAADRPPNEAGMAMSCVFQVLARLHHSGLVSKNVYSHGNGGGGDRRTTMMAFRPPGMYLLSTHIMSILSDAAWQAHEAEVAAKAAAVGQDSPFLQLKGGFRFRELGPEIWFELILWCCVDYGYYTEGVNLLENMFKRQGDLAWNLKSWESLLEHPRSVEKTDIRSEKVWRHWDSPLPRRSFLLSGRRNDDVFHGLAKRTISMEIVTAILAGVMDNVYLGFGFRGLSPSSVRQYINTFAPLLSSSSSSSSSSSPAETDDGNQLRPTRKAFNWLVVRNLGSAGIDPEADPHALERLLRSSPDVVPTWDAGISADGDDLIWLSKPQLFDETSALVGLIEYNMGLYASGGQAGAALRTFAWLQEIVQASKLQNMHDFPEEVLSSEQAGDKTGIVGFFNGRGIGSSSRRTTEDDNSASTIPQMSNVTLARLLDVATTAKAFKFGRWLLESDDADGPPIRPDAYADQVLAPSILRFAAATRDGQLCDEVVGRLTSPVSLNTLRALINAKVALGEWDRVVRMLAYIRDHRLKSWGHSNVAQLAAAVLDAEGEEAREPEGSMAAIAAKEKRNRAISILNRIFDGEFNDKYYGGEGGYQDRLVHSFRRLFMSMPGALREEIAQRKRGRVISSLKSISPYKILPIPIPACYSLLTSLVETYGSVAGKRLWEQWCEEPPPQETMRVREGGVPRLYVRDELRVQGRDGMRRFRHAPPFGNVTTSRWGKYRPGKDAILIPDLNMVRIIAQRALEEFHHEEGDRSSFSHIPSEAQDVLDFCIYLFRRLGLPDDEIRWELQGYYCG